MPQENKTMDKMIKEILVNLENIKENHLKEEVKEIKSTINIFTDQETPPQRKPEKKQKQKIHNRVPRKKLQQPTEYGRNLNKGEGIENQIKKCGETC